jgi:hypothetical protein
MRPGGAIRRKCRIPDGKVGERFVVMVGASKVVAYACVDYGSIVWPR